MKTTKRVCPFYQNNGSRRMSDTYSYCEFDGAKTICNGENKKCKKLNSLREYLMKREWVKMRIKR